jgi:hypothetical protein
MEPKLLQNLNAYSIQGMKYLKSDFMSNLTSM